MGEKTLNNFTEIAEIFIRQFKIMILAAKIEKKNGAEKSFKNLLYIMILFYK